MADADALVHDSEGLNPSKTSCRALDGLNVFLADVRDGMGPFLGTFLREVHHWDAGRVGIALAASQIGTVLAQTPAGAIIDRIRWKRLAVAIAAVMIAAGCVVIYLAPTLVVVVAAEATIGVAAAIFPPAVAALTLGLVGVRPFRGGRGGTKRSTMAETSQRRSSWGAPPTFSAMARCFSLSPAWRPPAPPRSC
jgi:MFS family permease